MKNLLLLFFASIITLNISAQWQKVAEFNTPVRCLLTFGNNIFAGTATGLFRSTDGGISWDSVASISALALAEKNNKLYAGSMGFFVSDDNGTTWTQTGLANCIVSSIVTQDINIFAGTMGNGIGGITGKGLFLSTNDGTSWQPRNNGIDYLDILGIDLSDSRIVSASSAPSGHSQYPGVLYSTNRGQTWALIVNGLPENITSKAVFSGASIYTIVNDYRGLYRSTNNGQSWHLHNSGFPNKPPATLIKFINSDNNCWLFAGCMKYMTGSGIIYCNKNDEAEWHDLSGNLPYNSEVWELAASEQYLVAGIDNTVWTRTMNEIVTSVDQPLLNGNFKLSQNYPNPFNPSTIIKYSLAQQGRVTLSIYDLLGREIIELIDEEKPAGEYETTWNASPYTSGVYLLKMEAGQFSETRKIILMK